MLIKTQSPLKEWGHLKFWNYYFDSPLYELEGLPAKEDRFNALAMTSPDEVKIVILGQDPYPTKGYAHGLAFSTQPHIRPIPRSLRNIFQEYSSDLGYPEPISGDLSSWAARGVLLLNTSLSVEEGKPGSHKGLGWEKLAYEVIRDLASRPQKISFILWGKDARQYRAVLAGSNHQILEGTHPSPLASKYGGFFGGKYFTKAAEFLGVDKDIWKLP